MTRKETIKIGSREYYTVSGVCAELGIFRNTLYSWEIKGKIPKAYRNPMSGWRLYTKDDIKTIKRLSGRS